MKRSQLLQDSKILGSLIMSESILSKEPDGCGYHYGFMKGDHRQLNVRHEGEYWVAYVGGDPIGDFDSKALAEAGAIKWALANQEEVVDDGA